MGGDDKVKEIRGDISESVLNRNSTDSIRALASILVVFVHLVRTMDVSPENPLQMLNIFAPGTLGIFFFYTGYNLLYGYMNKGGMLWSKGYWRKKITRIYLPFVLMNMIFQIYWWILGKGPYDIKIVIECLLGIYVLGSDLWYIQSVILIYLLFYVVFFIIEKLIPRVSRTMFVAISGSAIVGILYSLLYIRYGAYNSADSVYPTSLLAGMVFAITEKRIAGFLRKYKWELFFTFAFIVVIMDRYGLYGYKHIIAGRVDIYELIRPLVATLAVNTLIIDEKIKSPILLKISGISLPMYLTHTICYQVLRSELIYIENDTLYMLIYLTSLIIASVGVRKLMKINEKSYNRIASSMPKIIGNIMMNI